MEGKENKRTSPFLRCSNIPDSDWELLKRMSLDDGRSLSSFTRKLIKKEWQKEKKKEFATVG